jgi:hypothetical protein
LKGAALASSLATFWQAFQPGDPPFVHPADLAAVAKYAKAVIRTVEEHSRRAYFGNEAGMLQLGLLPAPFAGDLGRADIFILMLNPGFEIADFYAGSQHAYAAATEQTLRQDLSNEEFPFMHLNPEFCWSGGYRWWSKKLHDVARTYVALKGCSYREALATLSQHIASIELIPYHSVSGPSGALSKLPSAKAALAFVQNELLPTARRGEVTLIVTRKVAAWGIVADAETAKDIVIYGGGAARGAHLTSTTSGGEAILRRLL